jgi:hypothetical protein
MTAPVNAYFGSDPTALMSHPDLGVVVVVTLSAVPFYQLSGWVLFDGELVVTPTVSGTGVRVTVKTASYTLAYEDAGSAVEMNSATATTRSSSWPETSCDTAACPSKVHEETLRRLLDCGVPADSRAVHGFH